MRTQQEWQDRERELLETANRYLERARKAEARAKTMVKATEAFNKIIETYHKENHNG